ncbi:MAG TPA: hypothetical protein VK610_02435 [Rhodothermales bacterium]|nr:hypothetical protein [Rhodothermales bacterium]
MRTFLSLAALAAVLALAPAASAQTAFMPYLGYNFDGSVPTIGVAMRVGSPALPVAFQPGVEVTLDEGTNVQLDGNLILAFPGVSVSPYVGAGLAVLFPDEGETDIGANAIAGLVINSGFVKPFVQGRLTTDFDEAHFSAHAGVALNF